ncbi:hypothetical protein FRC02_002001 [Tulasnella sp. 418]|nr:hypothetical protein FRC02_002001 [Tulasnella sp. 418]
MPDIAYAFVLPVARRFLAFLERIMTSDDGQNPDTLLSQLYPHVICLLLTRDHDVWFEELRDSNHLNRFRSLLAGQPSDIPLDRQALLARQTFPGVLAPLYCFMTIWRQCKSQDVLTAKYHYLTSDWAARVDQALGSFVNPNSWTSFSWDISSRAVSEMIASIHEFVGLVVENGLLSGQASGNMIHKVMMFQQNLQRNFRRCLS